MKKRVTLWVVGGIILNIILFKIFVVTLHSRVKEEYNKTVFERDFYKLVTMAIKKSQKQDSLYYLYYFQMNDSSHRWCYVLVPKDGFYVSVATSAKFNICSKLQDIKDLAHYFPSQLYREEFWANIDGGPYTQYKDDSLGEKRAKYFYKIILGQIPVPKD